MPRSSYQAYLRSDHWRSFKKRYRQSDRPQQCQGCGSKYYELHHVTYERLGHEHLDDVVPLCRFCHKTMHGILEGRHLTSWERAELEEREREARKKARAITLQTTESSDERDRASRIAAILGVDLSRPSS